MLLEHDAHLSPPPYGTVHTMYLCLHTYAYMHACMQGGDGTVLHLASLFEHDDPLPPIISFAMGSL